MDVSALLSLARSLMKDKRVRKKPGKPHSVRNYGCQRLLEGDCLPPCCLSGLNQTYGGDIEASYLNRGFELLTVDEYAYRLKISRTTVFAMIKEGKLVNGVHFIKIGRSLRFLWDREAITSIGQNQTEGCEDGQVAGYMKTPMALEDADPARNRRTKNGRSGNEVGLASRDKGISEKSTKDFPRTSSAGPVHGKRPAADASGIPAKTTKTGNPPKGGKPKQKINWDY